MKVEIPATKEVEVKFAKIVVPVEHEDEDMPYDFPFRKNDLWEITIDIETGQIQDWPGIEETIDIQLKVVDAGTYEILDENKNVVISLNNEYVPHGVIPGRYGDYVDFKISKEGMITNWPAPENVDFFEFFEYNQNQ